MPKVVTTAENCYKTIQYNTQFKKCENNADMFAACGEINKQWLNEECRHFVCFS